MSDTFVEPATFSCGASLVFPGDQKNALVHKPDVVAPGVQVYSCIPPVKRDEGTFEYNYMDGTSMATPHVAGCAALLMAARPDAPVAEIVRALKETAAHPGGTASGPIIAGASGWSDPQRPWRPSKRPIASALHGPSIKQTSEAHDQPRVRPALAPVFRQIRWPAPLSC